MSFFSVSLQLRCLITTSRIADLGIAAIRENRRSLHKDTLLDGRSDAGINCSRQFGEPFGLVNVRNKF
jgi:hypothetical protein